ncbi:hypothetical protein [Shewanella denitrificans]|nr:hypothetical protein [Shewanella denitrificans]
MSEGQGLSEYGKQIMNQLQDGLAEQVIANRFNMRTLKLNC